MEHKLISQLRRNGFVINGNVAVGWNADCGDLKDSHGFMGRLRRNG